MRSSFRETKGEHGVAIAAPVVVKETANPGHGKIHLNYLDGLRAVTAIYVLIYHFFREIDVKTNSVARVISLPFIYGHNAVVVFIVLSGFCLMLPVTRNNNVLKGTAQSFIAKRAKRILPTYYLAVLFAMILIVTIIGNDKETFWQGVATLNAKVIITHFLMIHNIFPDTSRTINYCFWSIGVEWYIYFLFPALVMLWKRLGALKTTIIGILGSLLICAVLVHTHLNLAFNAISPNFIGFFVLGMLACHLSFSNNRFRDFFLRYKYWGVVLISLMVLIAGCEHYKAVLLKYESPIYNTGSITTDFLTALFAFVLLVCLSINTLPNVKKLFLFKPLVLIGTFAYSLYLIHAPLIEVLMRYVILPLNLRALPSVVGILLIGTPVIITIAWLFYLVAEKPFIAKASAKAGAQPAVPGLQSAIR